MPKAFRISAPRPAKLPQPLGMFHIERVREVDREPMPRLGTFETYDRGRLRLVAWLHHTYQSTGEDEKQGRDWGRNDGNPVDPFGIVPWSPTPEPGQAIAPPASLTLNLRARKGRPTSAGRQPR